MPSKFLFQVGGVCLLLLALTTTAVCAANLPNIKPTVMPLGDSLTVGFPLKPTISYRKKLRDDLYLLARTDIDYVGEYDVDNNDRLFDLAHEGVVGISTAGIAKRAAWKMFTPEIILLMAGTNDFADLIPSTNLDGLRNVAKATALRQLVADIQRDYQSLGLPVQIFISSIPPQGYPGLGFVTDALLTFLQAKGHDFNTVSANTNSVSESQFTAAFFPLMAQEYLSPDLPGIFRRADADGDRALSMDEFTAALKLMGEFILNKFISDYNQNVSALASESANTHYVDAGGQLTLADFHDGTHPFEQPGYDKMAPPWFDALRAYFAGTPRYWVGGNGVWQDGSNWSATADGTGGAGQPESGSVLLLQNGSADQIVTRDSAALPAQLLDLRIDATGPGNMTLHSLADLNTLLMAVGVAGKGRVEQSDATTNAPALILGTETGSTGVYVLDGDTSILRTVNEEIGVAGNGSFIQNSGTNDVQLQLGIGLAAGGSGTYTLNRDFLTANQELIGLHGTFIQNGGDHRVEAKSATAGHSEGTLTVAAGTEGHGLFQLQGGSLRAVNLYNYGEFSYTGGTLAAQFFNNGVLSLRGMRELAGDLLLPPGGQIVIPDAFGIGTPTRLAVTGKAQLDGTIRVKLAPGAAPTLGDSTAILTAEQGISTLAPGSLRLPLLPGKLILRGSLLNHMLVLAVDQVNCDDVRTVRSQIGQRGAMLTGDLNNDGVVDVRDLAIVAHKFPGAANCSN